MKFQNMVLTLVAGMTTLTFSMPAKATTLIDFENGFVDLQSVSTVVTADNQITFSVGSGNAGGSSPAFIAEVGGNTTAFQPNDGAGTPLEPLIGNFILTDDFSPTSVLGLNYFIEFENPVSRLSLDLLDYGDIPSTGQTATLTAFSDTFLTPIDSDVFTVTNAPIDANLGNLLVTPSNGLIQSASVVFSRNVRILDPGTAIDNIRFDTVPTENVPEPSSLLGLLAVLGFGVVFRPKKAW